MPLSRWPWAWGSAGVHSPSFACSAPRCESLNSICVFPSLRFEGNHLLICWRPVLSRELKPLTFPELLGHVSWVVARPGLPASSHTPRSLSS